MTGIHPMIEKYPLSRVADAYEQMHRGKVRFRVVLIMGKERGITAVLKLTRSC